MASMKLTFRTWDAWVDDDMAYVIVEIIETNKLLLLTKELNESAG